MNLDVAEGEMFDGTAKDEAKPIDDKKPGSALEPKPVIAAVTPPAAVQSQRAPVPVEADERGLFRGGTLDSEWRLATAYAQSGLMPAALNTPAKVLVALQVCRELGLPPMTSIGKIMVLNGTPAIFGDLPLALVRRSGLLKTIREEWTKDKDGAVTGAMCAVTRVDTGEEIVRRFSVEDAKLAGLWNKKSSSGKPTPWVLYPTRMLQMRSRSWALKDAFPDVLSGVQIAEYDNDATVVDGQIVGAEQGPTLADKLNEAHFAKAETDQK